MKLKKLLLSILVLGSFGLFSGDQATGQAVEEGNIIIDGFAGFPNMNNVFYRNTYVNETSLNSLVNIKGLTHVGGRFEYMLSDKVGMGLELSHVRTVLEWTEGTTQYRLDNPRTRAMIRMNFHFVDSSDKIDGYIGLGAGYKHAKFEITSTPNDGFNEEIPNFFPVAVRLAGGMRYFFTDNIGFHVELGLLGGGILHGGISAKF